MEIQDLFRVLWRKKWVIILIPIFTCLLTYQFLKSKEDSYTSEAKISTGFTIIDKVELGTEPKLLKDADVQFNNLLQEMNSSLVFNLVSYRLLLHDLDSTQEHFRNPKDVSILYEESPFTKGKQIIANKLGSLGGSNEKIESIYDLNSPREVDRVRQLVASRVENMQPLNTSDEEFELIRKFFLQFGYGYKSIRENLEITRIADSDFIEVQFSSENSALSAFVANTYCEEFIRYNKSWKNINSSESITFLAKIAEEKRQVLEDKIASLREFRSSNNIVASEEGGSTRMFHLASLENLRVEIAANVQKLDLTIARLKADYAGLSAPRTQNRKIVELQEEIKRVNTKYMAGGSTDRTLSDSMAALQAELRDLVAGLDATSSPSLTVQEVDERMKDATIDYQVERNRLSEVEAKIAGLKYGLTNQSVDEGKVSVIQNEIDVATAEYVVLTNKYNEALNKQGTDSPVRQVLLASPAATSSSVKKIYILGAALLSSLGFVLFAVTFREVVDHSLKTPSKFTQSVKLPLIGVLNKLNYKEPFNVAELFASTHENKSVEMFKSSLRKIRHQIEGMNAKVILFTSPEEKVGKTFLIYSLSYSLSLLNKKVLIIDTNFKNRSLTMLYGHGLKEIKVLRKNMVPATPLLAEVTASGMPEKEEKTPRINFNDLVNPTKHKNIFFIGNTGAQNSSPAELLTDKDFHKFISIMGSRFDYIFLEGASLKDYSDTKELVGFVEKVVTVFSADMSVQHADLEASEFLASLNGKSGGAILNNIDPRNMNL